nr:MAG TPA: hypothetical protein [Caudoviricetes sp.]DAP26642.1 MAG TPA: hypothetical protein [Bacteriophage sp.]
MVLEALLFYTAASISGKANRNLKLGAADSEWGSPLPPQKAVQIGLAPYISPMASLSAMKPGNGQSGSPAP